MQALALPRKVLKLKPLLLSDRNQLYSDEVMIYLPLQLLCWKLVCNFRH